MIKISFKGIWKFIKDVFNKFIDDKCPKLGAALSFYTIFSIAPLIVIFISVSALIYGREAARGEIVSQIQGLIGYEGAQIVQTAIKNAQYSNQGVFAIVTGFIALIIGSTVVFVELQDSLNIIWKVKPKPGRSVIKGLLKDRVQSFAMVLATGFLLLVSLVVSAVIAFLNDYISSKLFNTPKFVLDISNIGISLLMIFVLFMMIFKSSAGCSYKMETRLGWFTCYFCSFCIRQISYRNLPWNQHPQLYIRSCRFTCCFFIMGLLLAQIMFLGAEFTQVYANKYGGGIVPISSFMKYEESGIMEKK